MGLEQHLRAIVDIGRLYPSICLAWRNTGYSSDKKITRKRIPLLHDGGYLPVGTYVAYVISNINSLKSYDVWNIVN